MFPKKIHLTCKDKKNITNPIWIACYNKYKEIYTDYKIKLYDNKDIYRIVRKHFPKHLKIIKGIKNGGILSDVFRYLILYLQGGIYSDMDCEPQKHIHDLFHKQHYHGDNGTIYIYQNGEEIKDRVCDFYKNPCNNSQLINKDKNISTYKCMGHKYIKNKTAIILGEEFSEDYSSPETRMFNYKGRRIGVCQWFMISKPKQFLFKKAYLTCIKNIKKNMNMQKNIKQKRQLINYVLETTGPTMFSKLVIETNLNDKKLTILPGDFFCGRVVTRPCIRNRAPVTDNTYVRHYFTSSWQYQSVN